MRLLLCLAVILCSVSLKAQRNCGSMEHLNHQIQEDPKFYNNIKTIERATQHIVKNPDKAVNGIISIPVVVHVVYNTASENLSTSQIQSQITILTEDFRRQNSDANGTWPQAADTEIEFCLASVDPNGNATSGITRTSTSVTSFSSNDNVKFDASGGKDAWPAADYLNFWVCDLSGTLLGYAQFPGGSPSTDGIVCDYLYVGNEGTATAPFDLGRTATHEVGHWLNLRHIWGDGNCNFDDFVSDTPTSDASNGGCATGHVSCGTVDMVENYMDYSNDACMNLYTDGQKTRMRAIFDTGGARESLLNSNGCGNGTPPTCSDGIQNGNETGVDCGGPDCPVCPPCSGTEVTMTIILDNYPEETSWTLVDSGGNTVASGGTYGSLPDGSTVTEDFCLADGCYDYTIFDSYGDGICCAYGNGSYSLVDDGGNTLASGGAFGSSEVTNFCVNAGGGGPTCTDGIQNGNETGVDCGGPDCPACPTCSDGIQNGNETGVDCGGPDCHACQTCSDGIQNGNETGVDCGGPDCHACQTCSDGIQNGNETGVDCGGLDCDPCSGGCTSQTIENNTFDSGWGLWNDGGSDCRRSANNAAYAYSENRCVRLRDNTNSSTMSTDNLNLAAFSEVTIDFTFVTASMENGEDFWLQYSANGGATYSTLISWARGTDFSNGTREFKSVLITGTFSSTARFRFRCDASNNGDRVYIDDVFMSGCSNSGSRGSETILASTLEEKIDVQMFEKVNLFPNPAFDIINIDITSAQENDAELYIVNTAGKLVKNKTITTSLGKQTIPVDITELESGVYIMQLISRNERIVKKFTVLK